MKKEIWIVEHRTEAGKKCGCMECVVSFVASSLKKAEHFVNHLLCTVMEWCDCDKGE